MGPTRELVLVGRAVGPEYFNESVAQTEDSVGVRGWRTRGTCAYRLRKALVLSPHSTSCLVRDYFAPLSAKKALSYPLFYTISYLFSLFLAFYLVVSKKSSTFAAEL